VGQIELTGWIARVLEGSRRDRRREHELVRAA
jgi:hypothetical protein